LASDLRQDGELYLEAPQRAVFFSQRDLEFPKRSKMFIDFPSKKSLDFWGLAKVKNSQIWTQPHQSEAIRRDVAALDFADNDQRSLTEES